MSIEQLKADLKAITERLAIDPPNSVTAMGAFLQESLLPWLESSTDELEDMDENIEDLVHQSADILHADSADVLATVVAGGIALATELGKRVGNDAKWLRAIKEYRSVADRAKEILEEATIVDDDEEDDEDVTAAPAPAPDAGAGTVQEGNAE